jgi:prophage regulatory protein
MNKSEEKGFFRIWEITGCKKRGVAGLIPVSQTGWYNGVKRGIFPAPIKVGKINLWPVAAIEKLLRELQSKPI